MLQNIYKLALIVFITLTGIISCDNNQLTDQENKLKGESFLIENKNNEGITTTKTGLQYKVLKEGNGDKPKANSYVTVHYVGTHIDGKEFDSSVRRGKPSSFNLSRVIPGWTEALQLMKKGAKYKLFIPYYMAYGERGTQGIQGYSTLIFEVELLDFKY